MVLGLIILLAVIIFMAFFIGKNLDYTTTIWFFKDYNEVSVIVLVFIAFAVGIILALICLMTSKILKEARENEELEAKVKVKKAKKAKKVNVKISANENDAEIPELKPVENVDGKKPEKKSFFKNLAKPSDDKSNKPMTGSGEAGQNSGVTNE